MSSNSVEIIARGSFRAAQPNQVLIVAGSTVTFTAPADGSTVLALTDATAAILTPKPEGDTVAIAAGASVTFTFAAASGGPFCCQVVASADEVRPIHCPAGEDGAVLTILSSDRDLTPPMPNSV